MSLCCLLYWIDFVLFYARGGVATFLSSPVPTNDAEKVALSSFIAVR